MARSPTAHRFTVKEYHRMAEADVFEPDDRVELIGGEVFEMAPIGSRHAACVRRLAQMFWSQVGDRAIVSVQQPVQLGDVSEVQPDLALLRRRPDFYAGHHPVPPDVLLVVEVADTSLRHDLSRKTPLYVAEGVPEVWVVDLVANVVHVARGAERRQLRSGDSLSPLAFPDVVVDLAAMLD